MKNQLNWNPEAYASAFRFAAAAHRGQTVPGTDLPYLMHLSLVCMEVLAGLNHHPACNGNLAVQCALLHDVIEDTAVSPEQLQAAFDQPVVQGVLALTKDKNLAKTRQMSHSLQRIKKQPVEVWMVKLADRITNLAPPPPYWTPEKIQAYRLEALQIYDALHPASKYLAQRLQHKIQAYPEK